MPNAARPLGFSSLLFLIAITLIAGHLLLREYMPNPAVGAVGFILVAGIFFYVLIQRKDQFGFIMLVYCCSMFSFADNQGGLWNLMSFGMISLYLLLVRGRERFKQSDVVATVLILLLLLWNLGGWIINNPMPSSSKLLGASAFLGFLLMFYLASSVRITPERWRLFMLLTLALLVFQILVALNQRYAIFNWNTPLLGSYQEGAGRITYGSTNAQGTLRNSELLGEYAVLMMALTLPLLSSSIADKVLKLSANKIALLILLAFAIILLTSTRAAAILAVGVIAIYYLIFVLRPFAVLDRVNRQVRIVVFALALIPLVGMYIGTTSLQDDFRDLATVDFDVEGVISGKQLNRGNLFIQAVERLKEESWIFGFGYGALRNNQWAWFGYDPMRSERSIAGFHNLYVGLPMLFGWAGALAFLLLIVITWFRCIKAVFRNRKAKTHLVVIIGSFSMFWFIFLVDQYKISVLRNPNYFMMFWIWLGLANAAIRTQRTEARTPARSAPPISPSNTIKHENPSSGNTRYKSG
jgi:O-antigen ligase